MDKAIKILAVIQARTGSSRLPNKVLMNICGKTVLEHVVERVRKSKYIDEVVVATTEQEGDQGIVSLCEEKGIPVFRGSEEDVLDRYYQVSKIFAPQNIVRITADCPLHDTDVIDLVIKKHLESGGDYTSNTLEVTYPDGLDCEVFTFETLESAWNHANLTSQREHVTQYIINNDRYRKFSVENEVNLGNERWTLDTESDLKLIKTIYEELYFGNPEFGYKDVLRLLEEKPELRELNADSVRNEGLLKSLANDYYVK